LAGGKPAANLIHSAVEQMSPWLYFVLVYVTPFAAAIGAILGVFNTLSTWNRDRVRLRVIPQLVQTDGRGMEYWQTVYFDHVHKISPSVSFPFGYAVEVKNQGAVAVTISEVGFILRKDEIGRYPFVKNHTDRLNEHQKGLPLPQRLEPHTSIVVYADEINMSFPKNIRRFKHAYVETQSGNSFTGTSAIYKDMAADAGVRFHIDQRKAKEEERRAQRF
jgi:hypothetical protein